MKKYLRASLKVVGTLLLIGVVLPLFTETASAAFDKNHLLADTVMDNKSVMSASQINQFLNSHDDSCISTESGFTAKKPTGYSPSGGFVYGGYVSAGEVIYSAAQAYDINPQVLLVTLQKEQSIVTGAAGCSTNRIAKAMGYGCPDSGGSYDYSGVSLYRRNGTTYSSVNDTCVNAASKVGFSQQVIRAAWLLKFSQQRSQGRVEWAIVKDGWDNSDDPESCYSGPMTEGNWRRCPSGPTTYYDGLRSIDGQTVKMGSGATAALYWYTPHIHGNQNFVALFEEWFGSIVGTPFFKVPGDSKTYILGADDLYYHVPSHDVMEAYGYGKRFFRVASMPSSHLTGKTLDGQLSVLARFEGDPIYLVDRSGRYHFQSVDMLNEYGYAIGDEAKLPTSLNFYLPDSGNMRNIIKEFEGDRVFLMDNGQRRRFVDGDAYRTGDPAYNTLPYVNLSADYMNSLDATYPILGPNKLIRTYDEGSFGFWNGENYFNISRKTVSALGLGQDYDLHSSEINNLPRFATSVQRLSKSHGRYYLLDVKRKLEFPSSQLAVYGLNDADFGESPSNLLNRVSTKSMSRLIGVEGSDSKFLLRDGGKDHFDSSKAISEHGLSYSQLITLGAHAAGAFPSSGRLILATGTLFKISGQPQVYLINGSASKLYIDSRTMMSEYGFNFSSVRTFSASQVAGYSTAGTLSHFSRDSSNNVWLIHSGGKRQHISSALAASGRFNLTVSSLNKLSSGIYQQSKNIGPLKNLLGDVSNNRKYYVEDGNKRWITSPAALHDMGYTYDDVSMVSAAFIASLPTGNNIN